MEVHFAPDVEKKLNDLATQSGRESADALVQDVVEGYFDELAQTRQMLDIRYDDLKGGRVKPIDGEEFFEDLRRREDELLKKHSPYVGVHQAGFMGLEGSNPIGVGFNFINHGQTVAQKFNFTGVIDLLPYPLPQGYVLTNAPARLPQDGVIFPNETPSMTGWTWERRTIDAPTKKEIISANPKREIYAHGIATYDDIFGAHWRTEFCYFLNPSSFVRDANGIVRDKDGHMQFQWAPCFGHNTVY